MRVVFRCPPELADKIPAPIAAKRGLPDWLKEMPARAQSADFGYEVETVKQCPPFIDAMTSGFLMPLATDITVKDGKFDWDWDPPVSTLGTYTRAPIAFHVGDQLAGTPFFEPDSYAVKFINFWTVELEAGWGLLCTHPANRPDLPFQTVTGLVHADNYANFIHFPAIWTDPGFEGVLKRGTPVAQCYPVPLAELDLETALLDGAAAERFRATKAAVQVEEGAYRRQHRHRD